MRIIYSIYTFPFCHISSISTAAYMHVRCYSYFSRLSRLILWGIHVLLSKLLLLLASKFSLEWIQFCILVQKILRYRKVRIGIYNRSCIYLSFLFKRDQNLLVYYGFKEFLGKSNLSLAIFFIIRSFIIH